MTAFLPQHDPHPAHRKISRRVHQLKYTFNYTHVSPLAVVDRVPIHDEFSHDWAKQVGQLVLTGLANRAELELERDLREHHASRLKLLGGVLKRGKAAIRSLRSLVRDALRFEVRVGAEPIRPKSLDDYGKLFRAIGLPPVTSACHDDRMFAWMRVAGPNPLVLRKLTELDDRFPVTEAHYAIALPNDSLEAALAEGRLYLADYAMLEVDGENDYPHGRKYLYAPLALFAVDPESKDLLPVAIQCKQKPAADNPIFTPGDKYNWLIAKTVVEMADGNVHEAFSHLGRTHLFMEPFAITTYRQLASNHPLSLLLLPHFEGTLAINEAAWKQLIANKGAVEELCSAPIGAARALAAAGVQSAAVTNMLLPKTFAERGVDDAGVLPKYPFRDDAHLYWQAINKWVGDYISLYYHSDADAVGDTELQAWTQELTSDSGGRLVGMPNDSRLCTRSELVDVATLVLYTCSVQHAAVNFPQYDIMSYVPNKPLGLYAPAPTTTTGATEADYLAMLPPLDMAELQMEVGFLLGSVHYTKLSQYEPGHFHDHRVAEPLSSLQRDISAIGGKIDERNRQRLIPYTTLTPDGIPQSINI